MNNLPILYARGENDKILEWQIEVNGNKYRTHSGAQDCLRVTSEWTICQGKNIGRTNETSPQEQASKDAKSHWDKKVKSGGYWENIEDIDKQKFIQCMLANKFEDHKHKIKYPVMVDKKLNGGRCITTKDGQFTRKGEKYLTVKHLLDNLKSVFDKYPNLVLDGELYSHKFRFQLNEIMKLIRKTVHITPDDLQRSNDIIEYHVYDGWGFENITQETKCSERRDALKKILNKIESVYVLDYNWAKNEKDVYNIFEAHVKDGYEGSIVRVDAKYQQKRTNDLLKVKPENDAEAIIVDIHEGEGNWANTGKVISLRWQGLTFDATFKGTYEEGKQFLKDKNAWIGKEVTFLYNGLTGLGVPNYARVDIQNCLKQ
jgi:DNA ligase-1